MKRQTQLVLAVTSVLFIVAMGVLAVFYRQKNATADVSQPAASSSFSITNNVSDQIPPDVLDQYFNF